MRILAYSFLAALSNEKLWTRTSPPGEIDYSEETGGFYYLGDFNKLLEDYYRLEYTYSMLKDRPFFGIEKRKDAIFFRVKSTLKEVVEEIREVFSNVFSDWLKNHAITNATDWGRARVENAYNFRFQDKFESAMYEYKKYTSKFEKADISNPSHKRLLQDEFFKEILKINSTSDVFLDAIGGRDALIEARVNSDMEYFDENSKDFLEKNRLPEGLDRDYVEEQLTKKYNEIPTKDLVSDYLDSYGIEKFINLLDYNLDIVTLDDWLTKVYAKVVFPLWMKHWGPFGIVETRSRVDKAYQMLVAEGSLEQKSAAINHAINVSHQTGSMLDYVENAVSSEKSLNKQLEYLTKGEFTKDIDPTLREIGVHI